MLEVILLTLILLLTLNLWFMVKINYKVSSKDDVSMSKDLLKPIKDSEGHILDVVRERFQHLEDYVFEQVSEMRNSVDEKLTRVDTQLRHLDWGVQHVTSKMMKQRSMPEVLQIASDKFFETEDWNSASSRTGATSSTRPSTTRYPDNIIVLKEGGRAYHMLESCPYLSKSNSGRRTFFCCTFCKSH